MPAVPDPVLTRPTPLPKAGASLAPDARPRVWRRALGTLAALVVLLGAGAAALYAVDAPVPLGPEPAGLAAPLPPAHPPAGLAFGMLVTGESTGAAEALLVGRGRWTEHRRPVQAAVLVRHPQGTLLFDSGLGRQIDTQFAGNSAFHRFAFGYRRAGHRPAVDQLTEAGWDPRQVRAIVPSHLHWDHVSGLADFPDAEVWVTPSERAAAATGHAPAFLPAQWAHVDRWRDLRFEGPPLLGFAASHDVFGDGSVVLLPMGGHTAGQVGLLLRLPSGSTHLFTGDVTWTLEGVRDASDRSWLLRHLLPLDHDPAANRAVIAHLHQLSLRHPDIRIVPAHDEHVVATLPHFPALRE